MSGYAELDKAALRLAVVDTGITAGDALVNSAVVTGASPAAIKVSLKLSRKH